MSDTPATAVGPPRSTRRPDLAVPWLAPEGAHDAPRRALAFALLARASAPITVDELRAELQYWGDAPSRRDRLTAMLGAELRRGMVSMVGDKWTVSGSTLGRLHAAARGNRQPGRQPVFLRFLGSAADRGVPVEQQFLLAFRASSSNSKRTVAWLDSVEWTADRLGIDTKSVRRIERDLEARGILGVGAQDLGKRWRPTAGGTGAVGRGTCQNARQAEGMSAGILGETRIVGAEHAARAGGTGDDPRASRFAARDVAPSGLPGTTAPVPQDVAAVARLLEAHGVFARSPARREDLARNVVDSVSAADFELAVGRALAAYPVQNVGAYVARMAEGDAYGRTRWIRRREIAAEGRRPMSAQLAQVLVEMFAPSAVPVPARIDEHPLDAVKRAFLAARGDTTAALRLLGLAAVAGWPVEDIRDRVLCSSTAAAELLVARGRAALRAMDAASDAIAAAEDARLAWATAHARRQHGIEDSEPRRWADRLLLEAREVLRRAEDADARRAPRRREAQA